MFRTEGANGRDRKTGWKRTNDKNGQTQMKHLRSHFRPLNQMCESVAMNTFQHLQHFKCYLSLTLYNIQNNSHLCNCGTVLTRVSSPTPPDSNLLSVQQPDQSFHCILECFNRHIIVIDCCISLRCTMC